MSRQIMMIRSFPSEQLIPRLTVRLGQVNENLKIWLIFIDFLTVRVVAPITAVSDYRIIQDVC